MASYTQLTNDEVKKIVGEFKAGEFLDFERIKGGATTSNFTVNTDKGKFVLSVCDEKSFEDAQILVSLLSYLENQTFLTPQIIDSVNNNGFVKYGDTPVILKKFIEGEVHEDLNQNMLQEIGKQIGYLHSIPAPAYLPNTHRQMANFLSETNSDDLPTKYARWLQEKRDAFRQYDLHQLEKALIHGDLFYDNILFVDGNLNGIIDLEDACHYYKPFDLGRGIIGSCMNDKNTVLEKARALVKGYKETGTISETEQNLLQVLAEYNAIASSFWNFKQHNMIHPNSPRSDDYTKRLEVANEIHDIPKDKFIKTLFS